MNKDPLPDAEMTLVDALEWLLARINEGVECPLCGQVARVYAHNISASEAMGLIIFYRAHGTDWGHAPSTEGISRLGGAFARNALWGLLQESMGVREDGGRAGVWRVTPLGERFRNNQVKVQRTAVTYGGARKSEDQENRRLLALEGDEVSIVDALGDKFNYEELMGRTPENPIRPPMPLDDPPPVSDPADGSST